MLYLLAVEREDVVVLYDSKIRIFMLLGKTLMILVRHVYLSPWTLGHPTCEGACAMYRCNLRPPGTDCPDRDGSYCPPLKGHLASSL